MNTGYSRPDNPGVDPLVWRQHAWRNRLHSLLLLAVMAGFLALLGWLLWGKSGLLILVSTGVAAVFFNPALSPWLVMRLYGARPLDRYSAPTLGDAVAHLAERAGLEFVPALYYIPSPMPNAFAVGSPKRSAIAVTDGLLRRLSMRELVGVLAHETCHIRNNDLWVMGLADLFSRGTSLLSLMGQFLLLLNLPLILFTDVTVSWSAILLLIFAPTLSALAQLALSRTREFDADLNAARLTGDPEGLALALEKLERIQGGWLERIFLPGRRIPDPSLLRTHPDTAERIKRLMALKPRFGGDDFRRWPSEVDPEVALLLGRQVRPSPRWHITGLWH